MVVEQIRAAIVRIGWAEVARRSGIDRTNLHRAFGPNGRKTATLKTIERVLPHLGLRLTVEEIAR